jgi:hypothetical protein
MAEGQEVRTAYAMEAEAELIRLEKPCCPGQS